MLIYFDNAATTIKKPDCVKEAVIKALDTLGNPSRGAHEPSLMASRAVYEAREGLCRLLGVRDPSRIAFTQNATDSLNIAIKGILKAGDHVITTQAEHNSVLRPLYEMEGAGVRLTIAGTDKEGKIDYEEMEKAVTKDTRAIIITHVSNVTGNITDLEKVSETAKKKGLLLIVDGAQSAGSIAVDIEKSGIDIFCFTGHKGLFGPQGTGGIYVREGVELSPLRTGGSGIRSFDKNHPAEMPERLEAGTLNAHGIAGLGAAVEFIEKTGVSAIHEKEARLAKRFLEGIADIKGIRIYGDRDRSKCAAIVTINIEGLTADMVCDRLWDEYGICTRAGAHCAPLMHRALGTENTGAVRFSFSYFNTEEEIDIAVKALREIGRESLI